MAGTEETMDDNVGRRSPHLSDRSNESGTTVTLPSEPRKGRSAAAVVLDAAIDLTNSNSKDDMDNDISQEDNSVHSVISSNKGNSIEVVGFTPQPVEFIEYSSKSQSIPPAFLEQMNAVASLPLEEAMHKLSQLAARTSIKMPVFSSW